MTTQAANKPQADWVHALQPERAPEVSSWGLGDAWYLLFALIGLVILVIFALVFAHWRTGAFRRRALAELAKLDGPASASQLQQVSLLIRRIALRRFSHQQVAGLTGDAWLAFLDSTSSRQDFQQGIGRVLANGPYRPAAEYNSRDLLDLCRHWIVRNS